MLLQKDPLPVPAAVVDHPTSYPAPSTPQEKDVERIIKFAAVQLIAKKDELNKLDERVGDGDTGSTLALGCQQILADVKSGYYPFGDASGLCKALARSCRAMGGSSGALYEIFFTAAAGMCGGEGHCVQVKDKA